MLNLSLGYSADPLLDAKEAIRLVRLALALDPNAPETLGIAGVITAFLGGNYDRGIELADRAAALNPNSAYVWHNRGWVFKFAGLPEEAILSFERAIRMSPLDPLVHLTFAGTGMALVELRRFDEAVAAAKKALRQNQSFPGTYRCLASALAHLGRDAEAREAAARLLEVEPSFTMSGWIARGGQSNAKLLIEGLRKTGLPE